MKKNYKQKRLLFVISVIAISIAALIFVIVNFKKQIVFFYSPSELFEQNISKTKEIKVGGLVLKDSIKKIGDLTWQFEISDLENNLIINYQGLLPDLFREEQGVVAYGKFDFEQKIFFSNELLIKHDEKYMPPEVAKSLKKEHNKYVPIN